MTINDPYTPTVSMQPTSTTVLWSGHSEDLANLASGGKVVAAAYRLTEDAIHFEAGVLSRTAEIVPLWATLDVDMKQSLTQRARGLADLVIRLDPAGHKYGQTQVVLKSIRDAVSVRDLIARQANSARAAAHKYQHDLEIERRKASASQVSLGPTSPAPAAPEPKPADDLMTKLERLAALHAAGALTADEFGAAKAKLLA